MIRRIEQAVRPSQSQRAVLNDLKDAAAKAVDTLQAACPKEQALTPPGRLDAIAKRVETMLDAIKTVRPALAKFYDALNNEQKARFNTVRQRGEA